MNYKVHPTSEVHSQSIGEDTSIWQFCIVLSEAKIGSRVNICSHCFIENNVIIGNDVTVKSGVHIWDGITLKDKVFVGPNVVFTNDLYPRSKNPDWREVQTIIQEGASIGANSTIIAGVEIGVYSMIGAGSVVTKNIPPYTLWYGNPARHMGYITKDGIMLNKNLIDTKTGDNYEYINSELKKV